MSIRIFMVKKKTQIFVPNYNIITSDLILDMVIYLRRRLDIIL